jgi:hypothetical protein
MSDVGARSFIWAVIAGLVLGGVLVGHAGVQIFRAFPADTRAAATGAVKARPRAVALAAAVALWTILYLLYSLAYPSAVASTGDAAAQVGASMLANDIESAAGDALSVSDVPFGQSTPTEVLDAAGPLDANTARGTNDDASPGSPGGAPPAPCSVAAQAQAVRDAQTQAEALTGRPLGADGGAVVEALAGCNDPTAVALSLLGPVNLLLNDAGVPMLPLPALPGLPPFFLPEAVAAPLRGPVFDACGQILREVYTVAVVAPVLRIEFDDIVAVANYVGTACGAFAPAPSA